MQMVGIPSGRISASKFFYTCITLTAFALYCGCQSAVLCSRCGLKSRTKTFRTRPYSASTIPTELSNSNSPRSWRLRHTLDKVRNCRSSAIHDQDSLQERLHNQHETILHLSPCAILGGGSRYLQKVVLLEIKTRSMLILLLEM